MSRRPAAVYLALATQAALVAASAEAARPAVAPDTILYGAAYWTPRSWGYHAGAIRVWLSS
jgi:hypothetical protein